MASAAESNVSSIVLLSFRGDGLSRDAADAGAVAETILLNGQLSMQVVPQAVRFPRVFTEIEAVEVRNGLSRTTPGQETEYAILESEAVAVALDCAASAPRGAIIVPQWGAPFTAADAEAIVSGKPGGADRWEEMERNAGPLFPAESIEGKEQTGPLRAVVGARVNSPISRADEDARAVFSARFREAAPGARREWIEMATAHLYRIDGPADAANIAPGPKREKERL
jgi:hypothetical protein